MVEKKEIFSVRGRFANTKLCGAGRVELETGEIYDGVFRNGIFCSGICYQAKEDRFIYGNFKTPEIKLMVKGKGYPYQLFLNNKEKLYDSTLVYKTTCSEIVFAPQEDRHLVREFDRFKYNFDQVSSHQSSIQESIFNTSDVQPNLSQISEEMDQLAFQQYNDNNQQGIHDQDFYVADEETNKMMQYLKENQLNYSRPEELNYSRHEEQNVEDSSLNNSIKMTADFNDINNINVRNFNSHPLQIIDSIVRQRELRMQETQESNHKSNILIQSLKNKLETYENIKNQMKKDQKSNQYLSSPAKNIQQIYYESNNQESSKNKYQHFDQENDEKEIDLQPTFLQNYNNFHNYDNNINNNNNQISHLIKPHLHDYQEQLQPRFNENNENIQSIYKLNNRQLHQIDNSHETNPLQQETNMFQEYENNQSVKDSQNSQQSFATFSNHKKGMQFYYYDTDDQQTNDDAIQVQPKTISNEFMNIQIHQPDEDKKKQNKKQNNDYRDPQSPNISINKQGTQSANLSPKVDGYNLQVIENFSSPSLQVTNPQIEQYSINEYSNAMKEKLQKQLADQENSKRNQNEIIEYQKSMSNWEGESKDEEERNRQKSQFSVDFDQNITSKSNEQEMIENYFNNLRVNQQTTQNIFNSTGTISVLNDILSDQNYHSKGKGEDNSLMQILDDKLSNQNPRTLSIDRHHGIHRKFLDTSIQYLESEQNINAKESYNNSSLGMTHSFDRSERKTIDKLNPSQFYRHTQNSLSERSDELDEECEYQSRQNKGIDQVIEDNNYNTYSSFNNISSSANDRAFINSNITLTDPEQ